MKITREAFKNIVREVMTEESEYQTFFKKALEKTGKSIPDMSDEEKKAFFNKIDAAWQGKGEKNEELVGNQTKLDVDGDGEIEASDLAALRAGKKVNEATLEKGTKLRYEKNTFVVDYVVDKKYIGRDGYPKYILKVVKSNYPNKIKVGSTEEYEDARLTGLIRNRVMTFVKNEVVNEATLEKGTKLRYDKNSNVIDYVVDKKYIGRDGYPRYILKVVTSNTKNIKVGSTIEYDDARLTGLIRNRVMTFVKNESVDEAANLKTIAMLFQNKGIKDAVRKDHADKLRKIIEDSGVSTKGVSDSELIKVVKQLTSESVDEATTSSAPGEWVAYLSMTRGKKLLKTFNTARGAKQFLSKNVDKLLGGSNVESVGLMTKKQWDEREAKYAIEGVNEGKLSNTWQKNNKKGYVLKVGNIELKSAGPTNTHDILVNRQPWGTFHMDYESGGTDFWVKPLRGNDFWVKEIDDIVKKVKADPRFKESVSEAISYKDGKYHFYEKDGVGYLTYDGKVLSRGDYDIEDGSNSYWMSHSSWGGQKAFKTGKDVIAYFKKNKIVKESINEAGGTVRNPKTGKDVKISTALSYGKSHPAYQAAKQASGAAKKPLGPPPGVKAKPPVNAKPAMGTKVTSPAPTNAKPAMGTKVTSAPPKNAQPPIGTKVTGPPSGVKAKPPVIAPPSAVKKSLGPPPGVKPKGSVPPPPPPPPPPSGKPSVGTPPGVKAKPPVIAPPSAAKAPLGPPPGVRPKGAVPPPPPPPPPTKSKFEDKESVKEKKKIKK